MTSGGSRLPSFSVKVVTVLLSLMACAVFLEIVLRMLPVSEGFRALSVNEANPVYRYAPNRAVIWSKGWNFAITNRVRTNNVGFLSELDYDSDGTPPLLALVGDSYIEAAMVPPAQTVAAQLRRMVGRRGRVYSFGSSGSALSQYLAYARYARDRFHPDGLVVTIVGNDFDESLLRYKTLPGFHYFSPDANGVLQLVRLDREIPPWREWVASSAVGMYLIANLEIGGLVERTRERMKGWLSSSSMSGGYVGNSPALADPVRVADSQRAVDAFLELLPGMAGLSMSKILLVVDAPRPELYEPLRREAVRRSYFGVMRTYLMEKASAKGFEVVDMERAFLEDYSRTGRRYEHPQDFHWNSAGHEVVARMVSTSRVYESIFAR